MKSTLILIILSAAGLFAFGQENYNYNKFKQLKEEFATPNVYRTASGAPGHEYYQQKADYKMSIKLDDENQKIFGEETIRITSYNVCYTKLLRPQLSRNPAFASHIQVSVLH